MICIESDLGFIGRILREGETGGGEVGKENQSVKGRLWIEEKKSALFRSLLTCLPRSLIQHARTHLQAELSSSPVQVMLVSRFPTARPHRGAIWTLLLDTSSYRLHRLLLCGYKTVRRVQLNFPPSNWSGPIGKPWNSKVIHIQVAEGE